MPQVCPLYFVILCKMMSKVCPKVKCVGLVWIRLCGCNVLLLIGWSILFVYSVIPVVHGCIQVVFLKCECLGWLACY